MAHRFVTSCIDALGEDINEMKDIEIRKDLSTRYFIEKIAPKLEIDKEILGMLGFDSKKAFAEDWALRCASSYYQGIPCYYVQWSAIEFVFVDANDFSQILRREDAEGRQAKIYEMGELLDDVIEFKNPVGDKACFAIATEFEQTHRVELREHRIPLSSMAQHRCDHSKAFALFDKKHFGVHQSRLHESKNQSQHLSFN